jgi:hypothetical protein
MKEHSNYGQGLKKICRDGVGGRGAQFDKDGKPANEAVLKTCFACHELGKARDLVITHYAP